MAVTLEELQIIFKAEFAGLQADLNRVKAQLSSVDKAAANTKKAFAGMGTAIKGFVAVYAGRALIRVGKDALAMANEAVESENLFSESMRGMSQSAREWSEELSGSLGLNAYALRKNVGTMNVMLRSMGLSEQKAYDMSTSLVQLSEDMASFYNLSSEDMFQKIQSGMTGMAMPLKQLGILVEDGTAKQYAAAAGISNTTGELTQQEKVLARYAALMGQTTAAQGDLARTINSPSNQLRVLNAQLEQAKINLGRAFQPIQAAVMPILLNLAKAATIAAQAIAYLMGALGGMTGVNVAANLVAGKGVTVTDKLTDSLQDTAKAYKKAGGAARQAAKDASVGLKGFDEINKVSEAAAKTGGGGGDISFDEFETPDLGKINDFLDNLETIGRKARELADKIKAAWAIIKPALAGIGAAFLAFKLTGNPLITLAVGVITAGVIAIVDALNRAKRARLDKAFGDIAFSVEEAATIVEGMASDKTRGILKGIEELKDRTDAALQQYSAAAEYTKKVLVTLLLLPMTTGEEQFYEELEKLKEEVLTSEASVRKDFEAYLDMLYKEGKLNPGEYVRLKNDLAGRFQRIVDSTSKMEADLKAVVNAAMEDGEIDDSEKETIRETLQTGSQEIVDAWEDVRAAMKARIYADLKAGRIPPGVAESEVQKVNSMVDAELEKHKLNVAALTAKIDKYNWTTADLTEEQRTALTNAVQAEVTAAEEYLDAVKVQVLANAQILAGNVTGGDALVTAVGGIFESARSKATEAAAELKALLEGGVEIGGPEFLKKVQEARQKYIDALEYITNGITSAGAFNKAAADLSNLSAESVDNFITAFKDRMTAGKKNLQDAYDETVNFAFSFPDEATAEFAKLGLTLDEGLALAKTGLENGLSELASDTVLDAAKALMPALSKAIASGELTAGDITSFKDKIEGVFADIDFSTLSLEAQEAALELKEMFASTLSDGDQMKAAVEAEIAKMQAEVEVGKVEVARGFSELGTGAMEDLKKALSQGQIEKEMYDRIIKANADGTLKELADELYDGGNVGVSNFIDGLLDKSDEARNAGKQVSDAVDEALSSGDTSKHGESDVDDYTAGIKSGKSGAKAAAAEVRAEAASAFGKNREGFTSSGAAAGAGFVSGIESKIAAARAAAARLAQAAAGTLRTTLEVRSPSRVTEDFGEMFTLGFVNKIKSGIPDVKDAVGRLSATAIDSMSALSMSPMLNNQIEVDNGVSGAVSEGISRGVAQVMDRLNISLNVDGEQFGKMSLRTINDAQRAAGRILLEM